MEGGPSAGLTRVYFLSPWRIQLELVNYPDGMAVMRHSRPALVAQKRVKP